MTAALEGTGKPFVVTSGVNIVTGKVAEETDPTPQEGFGAIRGASEIVTLDAAANTACAGWSCACRRCTTPAARA